MIKRVLTNKYFNLAWLLFGCVYFTWFGFLKNPNEYTASMIGLEYYWGFKFWGIIQSIALALNILYMYRRYGHISKFGITYCCLAAVFIIVNVCIPSTEIFSFQLVAHWGTALLFAFAIIAAVSLVPLRFARQSKRMLATLMIYLSTMAAMITLLAVLGKSGTIENLPLWATYLALFLLNYTGLYRKCLSRNDAQETPV